MDKEPLESTQQEESRLPTPKEALKKFYVWLAIWVVLLVLIVIVVKLVT